jgi:hypothetical protein
MWCNRQLHNHTFWRKHMIHFFTSDTLTLCRSYLNRYCLGRKTAFFSVGI